MKKALILLPLLISSFSAFAKNEVYYNFSIQNTQYQELLPVLELNKHYYILLENFKNIPIEYTKQDIKEIDSSQYVALDNFGITQLSDGNLVLFADPLKLKTNNYHFDKKPFNYSPFESANYLNYSLFANNYNNQTHYSLASSYIKSFDNGVIYGLSSTIQKQNSILNEIYREQIITESGHRLRLGTSSTSYNSLINSAQFFGFQFFKDPDIKGISSKNSYLNISGVSDTRSVAEIFVNDKHFGNTIIEPGPYNIIDLTGNQNSNDVKLVFKDDAGNVRIQNFSLLGTPYNLNYGESTYSFEAGAYKKNNNEYKNLIVNGNYAYGLKPYYTIETHIESLEQQQRVSVNNIFATKLGTFQYGIAKGDNETLFKYQYNLRKNHFNFNLAEIHSDNFSALGNPTQFIPSQTVANLNYSIFNGNYYINYAKINHSDSRTTVGTYLNYKNFNIGFGFNQQKNNNGVFLSLLVPLDSNHNDTINSSVIYGDNNQTESVSYYNNEHNFGVGAQNQKNDGIESNYAYLNYSNNYGTLNINNINSNHQSSSSLRFDGGIIFDHGTHFTNTIYNSYAIVDTEFPNVPILLNYNSNKKITSNDNGIAAISNLSYKNHDLISIDNSSLPLTLTTSDNIKEVSPFRKFSSHVKFDINRSPVLLDLGFKIKSENITINDQTYLVQDNFIYFDKFVPDKKYFINLPNCKSTFTIPTNTELNQIISIKCGD